MVAHKRSNFGIQPITSRSNNQVFNKELLLWQQQFHNMSATLGRNLRLFRNCIFGKTAANFFLKKNRRKHAFNASNKNITKNRMEMKDLKQILLKKV